MANLSLRYISKQIVHIKEQIGEMEKLLKLLLVNDLIDDVDSGISEIGNAVTDELKKEIRVEILKYGIKYEGRKTLNDIQTIILKLPKENKLSASSIKKLCTFIRDSDSRIEPVFVYENLAWQHRKNIVEAGVSFAVEGKELHLKKQEK